MLAEKNIETISYFQVDNPLVKIIDPVFTGFHIMNGAEISSKAIKKTDPQEKVGVFVEFANGKMGVVEYSDLPQDKMHEKNESGELKYSSGSIAIHLFSRKFVEKITSGVDVSLQFHTAVKKIMAYVDFCECFSGCAIMFRP